jgi:carbonic anhydrase
MRDDDLSAGSGAELPVGPPKLSRRTMLLGAGCVALELVVPGRGNAVGSMPRVPRRSAAGTLNSQSPIDLRPKDITFVDSLPAIAFAYPRRVDVTLVNTGSPDEEKTVRADVPPGAALLDLSGERWELVQFHWHTPSEHRVKGRATPLEMHLVHHRSDGTAADGPFLVIGMFLERGDASRPLARIFDSLAVVDAENETVSVPGVNLRRVLPRRRESYRYSGSLTTPPFTEPVSWVVLGEPIEVSSEQIAAFQALFPEGNTRQVQPLNDREVLSDTGNVVHD